MSYKPNDHIVDIVADIYEDHKIGSFGFDPIQLCNDMGYNVIPYSIFDNNMNGLSSILLKQDTDGFSWFNPNTCKGEIYYNDRIKTKQRIKYTIPHELGHLELGHIFQGVITNNMEEAAKEFARQLYIPHIILVTYNIMSVLEVMSTFDITISYAGIILDRLQKRLAYYGENFSANEYRILEAFEYNRRNKK